MIYTRCCCAIVLSWLLGVVAFDAVAEPSTFDLIIRNGMTLDGSGNPAVRQDIGLRGDTIVAIGDLSDASALRIIEATGLFVVPGFIDLHSHADWALSSDSREARKSASLVTQGLTTVVGGADGGNVKWPLSDEIAAFESGGMGMNLVPMVGHNTIRGEVLGLKSERQATASEIERMKAMVTEGMDEGAWGLYAGLEYRPGRFSTPEEVLALCEVVAEHNGFYIAHQRSEATMPLWQLPSAVDDWPIDGLQALEETINIARQTGIPVVASHMKARGRSSFGRSAHDILLIDKAWDEGLQIYLDVYPYETFGGGPRRMLPAWALVDEGVFSGGGRDAPVFYEEDAFSNARANLQRRWADPALHARIARDIRWIVDHNGGADRVMIVDFPDAVLVGKTLDDLARERGVSFQQVVVDLALTGYPEVPGGAWIRGYGIHDIDVENYIRKEYTATGSDAAVSGVAGVEGMEGGPGSHPRHFGAFVRKIARYVKDKKIISLPFAVRAATSLPASIIGLQDRGYIRVGFKADLVVLDYDRLRDRATVLEPEQFSEGIEYVINNGVPVVEEGQRNDALPGVVIRRTQSN